MVSVWCITHLLQRNYGVRRGGGRSNQKNEVARVEEPLLRPSAVRKLLVRGAAGIGDLRHLGDAKRRLRSSAGAARAWRAAGAGRARTGLGRGGTLSSANSNLLVDVLAQIVTCPGELVRDAGRS
jgi:hypothetical protein